MAHSACMRYGHFSATNPLRANLRRSPLAHAWRFESAWDKFAKGDMVVIFYYDRPTSQAGVYHLQTPPEFANGVSITASMVLQWYLRIRDAKFPSHPHLFPNLPSLNTRRQEFCVWLRDTIIAAVPTFTHLHVVMPHGLRAGWLTDRRREGTPDSTTMREGRWADERSMGLYDRLAFSHVCPTPTVRFTHT